MDAMAAMFANAGSWIVIKLCYLLTLVVIALTTIVVMVLPLLAELSLALAAVFLPLCLAFYPLVKEWALNAINVMMGSVAVTVAVSLFAKMFLAGAGVLAKGAAKADAIAKSGDLGLALGAGLGMIVVSCIVLLLAWSLPGIVTVIFSGASLSSSVKQTNGMLGKGAGAAAKGASAIAAALSKLAK